MKNYKEHIGKKVECVKGGYKGLWFIIYGWQEKEKKFICRLMGDPSFDETFYFRADYLNEVIEKVIYKRIKLT